MSTVIASLITTVIVSRMAWIMEKGEEGVANTLLKKALHLLLGIPITWDLRIYSKTLLEILNGTNYYAADFSSKVLAFSGLISSINVLFLY